MTVEVNGKNRETDAVDLYGLVKEMDYSIDETVVIKNGFQVSENRNLAENDIVTIISKGKMPSKEELNAMMSARHTPGVHNAVKDASVAIMGLGGLGSNIAIMLARTGVGHLHLVDFDVVEPSNLNRQQYLVAQLGMFKTDAMKELINQINPYIDVTTDCVKVTKQNAVRLVENADIVCEAFDKPDAKGMLTDAVLESTDKILVAASGMAGLGDSNLIKTRKITNRFYICGDGQTEAREGMGLMAPRVSICAAHQANIILRLITNMED